MNTPVLDGPQELARRLMAGESLQGMPTMSAEAACALGWELKALCYASWSSEPQRAVGAAAALRRLRDGVRGSTATALPELDALVAWTHGIACLIEGEMEDATQALDGAATGFQALGQAGQAAQTQVPKIMALAMLGRHDEAAQCADAAQRALIAHGEPHAASKVLLNLGNLHLRADRYRAAAERLREAATLFASVGDSEHSVMAQNGLADALTALGEFDAAALTYARAGALAASQGFAVLQALVQESVALHDLVRGRYREALAGLEGSRQRYAALKMPQQLAIAEKQLADAYLELRLLPEAIAGHGSALARFEALDMQVDRAWTLVQRGRAQALAGRRTAALDSLTQAAQLFDRLDNGTGAAAVTLAQAELALAGNDVARALSLARRAAQGFAQAGLLERELRAESVQAQALLQLALPAQAAARFAATLERARQHQLQPVQLRCLTGCAMAAVAQNRSAAARQDLQAAVDLFEDQRRTLPGDELRGAFQDDHLQAFQLLLRLELDAHAAGQASAAAVLVGLDRARARTLSDRLGDDERDGDDVQDPGTQNLRSRLAWLYRRLRRLHEEGRAAAAVSAELRRTEHELLERARRQRLAAPAAATGRGAELDLALLQRRLETTDALVEYGVQGEELFACVLTRDGVQLVRHMAAWPGVVDAVRAMRFQIETLRHGSAPVQRHLPMLEQRVQARLEQLHAMLWQPLAPLLAAMQRVLVVPQGPLGAVPFAALHDGEHCLADKLQLSLAPSARLALHALGGRDGVATRVLALGESQRLPHAAREATAVAGLLPQGRAYVGAQATLARLLEQAGSADVIHLACHAQHRSDNPVFSALHLHDTVLTAEAIASMQLPAALVVLSGCETALGESGSGDEMLGLTRAFLRAGASRVLAALWPVDDASTADLMFDFYAGLRNGHSPGAALRQAQLEARRRRAHPFYWAPFVLTGRW